MDHAAAHERLADLALEPGALEGLDLERPAEPDDRAFVEHVRDCPACAAELGAMRALRDRLDLALRGLALDDPSDAAATEPMEPPASLRSAVLEAARREPRAGSAAPAAAGVAGPARPPGGRFGTIVPAWAGAVAATLVLAFLGGLAGSSLLRPATTPDPSLSAALATLDRVLAAPDHRLVQLRTPAGAAAGSVAWSGTEFAVLTSSLAAAPPGRVYRCWLVWSGRWAAVGIMDFAGPTAYWTEPLGRWAEIVADPATRFVVTLEPAGASPGPPTDGPVLEATLGS